jgi:hypothetical protein
VSQTKNIKVTLPFDDLPDSAEVTGRAIRKNPPGFKDEEQADDVVYEFRRKTLSEVRTALQGLSFTTVEISDIRFA